MWELKSSTQVFTFLAAVILGGILCVIYDVFRALRSCQKNSSVTVAVEDIVFWVFSSITTFILFLAGTNGEVRFFVILGEILGFVVIRLTFSRVIYKFFLFLVNVINALFCKIYSIYILFLKRILILYKRFFAFLRKKAENMLKLRKKLLKNNIELLYTKTDN